MPDTPDSHIRYIPITTADAVLAVRNGAWLFRAKIPDFRALLEGIKDIKDKDGNPVPLHCVGCRILDCNCSDMEIANPLDFSPPWYKLNDPAYCTVFTRDADFSRAKFTQDVDFSEATFTQDADFRWATFTKNALFSEATFTQNAGFRSATFTQNAVFHGATFTQNAGFRSATFTQNADFHGATFTQKADFRWTTFSQLADFNKAALHGIVDFSQAKFGRDARLSFVETQTAPATQIRLTIDQLGRRSLALWVRDCLLKLTKKQSVRQRIGHLLRRFIHLYIRLSVRLIHGEDSDDPEELAQAAAQYNMLRDNFRKLPSTDDEEDRCHYKYKDLTRRAVSAKFSIWKRLLLPISRQIGRGKFNVIWRWSRRRFCHTKQWGLWGQGAVKKLWCLWDWAVMKWCLGYGIYTKRILITSAGVIALFAAVYGLRGSSGFVYNRPEKPVCGAQFNPIYFSIITFTTIGYGDLAPVGAMRYVCGAEGLLGLVLLSVFTVSFSRKLIR